MAGVRERGGRFMGYYKVGGKQKGAGTFDTWEEADHAGRVAEAGKPVKEPVVRPSAIRGKLTVAGYMPVFLDGHRCRETTRETYRAYARHVVNYLGSICLEDLSPADVRTFARKLEASELSSGSVKKAMTVLRQMCAMAVIDGKTTGMTSDPTATIKAGDPVNTEMRILTDAEYRAILGAINPHYRLLVRTLWATGMRWGEALAVRPDAVYQRNGRWYVRVKRTMAQVGGRLTIRDFGKTRNAMREISIPVDLARELIDLGPEGFKSMRGGGITRSNFRRTWIGAQRKAGITDLARVHDIRHTVISRWANAGISLVAVRDRAGHSDISTTSRYLHHIDTGKDPFLALAA